MSAEAAPEGAVEAAVISDRGTTRQRNEDHCGILRESATRVLLVVADGVSSSAAGDTASRMAVQTLLRAYQEEPSLPPARRLPRAVQQANIQVHDLALMVPELRGMATTLTALVVHHGELTVAHVGDCRLYRLRAGTITQLTKDHTVTAERVRLRLMSHERARVHAHRSVLTRSLGRELIVALDRITAPLQQDDVLICCSDGLYNVLPEAELAAIGGALPPEQAARALVDTANRRGTDDNLTAAVLRVQGPTRRGSTAPGLGGRLLGLIRRRQGHG